MPFSGWLSSKVVTVTSNVGGFLRSRRVWVAHSLPSTYIIRRWHNLDSPSDCCSDTHLISTFQAIFYRYLQKIDPPYSIPSCLPKKLQFSVAQSTYFGSLFSIRESSPHVSPAKQDAGHEHTNIGVYGFTKTVFSYERKDLPPNNPNKPTKKKHWHDTSWNK